MRNVNSKVSDPNMFVTCPGDRYHITFSPKVMPSGEIMLVESGKEDVQEFIDSFRDQTDIAYMIHQLQLGDTSVLTNKVPQFGDFTEMPKTYAESLQMVIDAERQFSKLPLDVKNNFDNDFRKWIATSGSEEWLSKMDSIIEKTVDDVSAQSIEKTGNDVSAQSEVKNDE